MKRAKTRKISVAWLSLSGAGPGDLGRRRGPVQVLEIAHSVLVGIFLMLT